MQVNFFFVSPNSLGLAYSVRSRNSDFDFLPSTVISDLLR